jgi:hypothetical protein
MKHSSNLSTRLVRIAALVGLVVVAFAVSGCNKDVQAIEAKEGGRVYMGNLFYQVNLSRMLNPKDVEDSYYLQGQPTPAPGDTYFGVFMRVDNETQHHRILPIGTDDMKIVTASGDVFKPIKVNAPGWGYAPSPIGYRGVIPVGNTPAYIGPIRGGLILFRMSQTDLNARPVKLETKSPDGRTGEITLDV